MTNDLYRQNYKLIDWSKPIDVPKREQPRGPRSDLAVPMIICDEMPETQSMVDGSWHTSKSGIRATYKPSGNREGKEYTELGNDKPPPRPRHRTDRKAIKESVEKAIARHNRGERV